MFTWLKNKAIAIWNWFKRQWKKIAIGTVVASTLVGAELLTPEQILPDHQLKAAKEKIVFSAEARSEKGERYISYDYISDIEVGQEEYGKIKEEMSLRTENAQLFKKSEKVSKGVKTETWVAKVYAGSPFIKQNGKWYQIKTATTTIKAFEKQTEVSLFDKLFSVYALSTTTYAGAGDGFVAYDSAGTWASRRGAVSGDAANYTNTTLPIVVDNNGSDVYYIYRGYIPIDTSGLPAGSLISSSTLLIYPTAVTNEDNDGNDYLGIQETFHDDKLDLIISDYCDIGYGDGGELPCQSTSTNQVVGGQVDISTLTTSRYHDISLNATGLTWIKDTSETSKCGQGEVPGLTGWTCLGLRIGHDILNDPPTGDARNQVSISSASGAGAATLLIEYTISVSVAEPEQIPIIIFE